MSTKLPIRLAKDPLVGVMFELRFSSNPAISNILPGYLFTSLGCKNINKTPESEIPDVIRNSDPNLMYAPLLLIEWDNYQIFVGERSIALSCNMPYQGWTEFNPKINKLLQEVVRVGIKINVERYSLKYTDIIEHDGKSPIQKHLNVDLNIGGQCVELPRTQVRTEKEITGSIIITQLIGSADAILPSGVTRNGFLIDVDAINLVSGVDLQSLLHDGFIGLDELHEKNKITFFDLISNDGLRNLEPIYD